MERINVMAYCRSAGTRSRTVFRRVTTIIEDGALHCLTCCDTPGLWWSTRSAPEDKIAVLDRQPTLSRSRTRRRRGSYRTLTRPPGADGCKHGLDARLAEGKDSQPARH